MSFRKLCWLVSRSPSPHASDLIEWDILPFEWFDLDKLQLLVDEAKGLPPSLSTLNDQHPVKDSLVKGSKVLDLLSKLGSVT